MAVLNFNMTIADADVAETASAVKGYFNNPGMTDAQAIEALRQEFIARLKNIVESYNRKSAVTAAEAADYSITVS